MPVFVIEKLINRLHRALFLQHDVNTVDKVSFSYKNRVQYYFFPICSNVDDSFQFNCRSSSDKCTRVRQVCLWRSDWASFVACGLYEPNTIKQATYLQMEIISDRKTDK